MRQKLGYYLRWSLYILGVCIVLPVLTLKAVHRLRVAQAAAMPASSTAQRGITYAGTSDPAQQLDVYMPAADSPVQLAGQDSAPAGPAGRPVILWVHGGGWTGGHRDSAPYFLAPFIERGWVGVGIGYRLAPAHVFPAQLDDVRWALEWVRGHIAEYGGDPRRVVAYGGSAGGHLVMLLGNSANADAPSLPGAADTDLSGALAGVISYAGPSDLSHLEGFTPQIAALVNDFLGAAAELDGTAATLPGSAAASPVTYSDAADPPLLCIHGTADDIVPFDQPQKMLAAAEATGQTAELLEIPGHGHDGMHHADPKLSEYWTQAYAFASRCVAP